MSTAVVEDNRAAISGAVVDQRFAQHLDPAERAADILARCDRIPSAKNQRRDRVFLPVRLGCRIRCVDGQFGHDDTIVGCNWVKISHDPLSEARLSFGDISESPLSKLP